MGRILHEILSSSKWTYYGCAQSFWPDRGSDTYILDSTGARGGSGKGITRWHEGNSNSWAGGDMSKFLGTEGYSELYVRYYLKYSKDWSWSDGSGGAQQKLNGIGCSL